MSSNVEKAVRSADTILLDFDGPVCSVFAGYPAQTIAEELRETATENGWSLPPMRDPLDLLEFSREFLSPQLLTAIEDALIRAETEAVTTAHPTEGADEFLHACVSTELSVVIVSNNSCAAIERYLAENRLSQEITAVIGRKPYLPELMKPSPHAVQMALKLTETAPEHALMIGDSVADIHAATASHVPVIGYANTERKRETLSQEGALHTVTSMNELTSLVERTPLRHHT